MKIMIHCCPQRMWYVDNFLIPSILEHVPMDDIIVWCDSDGKGNLLSFVESARYIKENCPSNGGIWHLQDDVLLASRFFDVADDVPENMVCNGCSIMDEPLHPFVGIQPIIKRWLSFPCIYIPNVVIAGFFDWFVEKCVLEGKYADKVKKRKYDDLLFWQYMKERHKGEYCLNICPNIAQHVDYIIGGTLINGHHKQINRSFYWEEDDKERELADKVAQFKKEMDIDGTA